MKLKRWSNVLVKTMYYSWRYTANRYNKIGFFLHVITFIRDIGADSFRFGGKFSKKFRRQLVALKWSFVILELVLMSVSLKRKKEIVTNLGLACWPHWSDARWRWFSAGKWMLYRNVCAIYFRRWKTRKS